MACTDAMTEYCAAHSETYQLLVAMRTLSWGIKCYARSAVRPRGNLLSIEVLPFSLITSRNRLLYLYGNADYWFKVAGRFATRT